MQACFKRAIFRLPPVLSAILPRALTDCIESCGAPAAEELRLHSKAPSTVTCQGRNYPLSIRLTDKDLQDLLQRMCEGSLYAYEARIREGFLPMEGGIRVGVCGSAAVEHGRVIGVHRVTGLIVRIPHRVEVDASPIVSCLRCASKSGGVLIYAPPGVGKTTLLRGVAEEISRLPDGWRTVAVDTREELSTLQKDSSLLLDVLVGYPRDVGIAIAVRSLGAELILCDEIGGRGDADAILHAAGCGIPIVATAHASTVDELLSRPMLLDLHRARVFHSYVGLSRSETRFTFHITAWESAEALLRRRGSYAV